MFKTQGYIKNTNKGVIERMPSQRRVENFQTAEIKN